MIVLATFGPGFGLPDPSPFVTKAEMLLKLSGLPYETQVRDLRKAPKGKLPFIEDDGQLIADSTFIRLHLERKYGIDFDRGLTSSQRGTAWAVEKMLEDHLYWALLQWRWLDDDNFNKGPAKFFAGVPGLIRPFVMKMVRNSVRKSMHGHGIGRHSTPEIAQLGERCLTALSDVLGDNQYLLGPTPCGADATAFSFTLNTLCPHFENPLRRFAERIPNLVAYSERMKQQYYA